MKTHAKRATGERGIALVAVLTIMVLLMGLAAGLHSATMGETALRGSHARTTAGFYAAESGINRAMGEYRNMFLNFDIPDGADFNQQTFTLGARQITYQLTSVPCLPTVTRACGAFDGCRITVPAGKPFAGLSATECRYTASAGSQLTTGDTEATLGNEFDVDSIPLFQFLAFYSGDLEILPGADMTLHGPIFTNGDLYLNSNATLTILDCYPSQPPAGQNYCPTAIPTVNAYAAKNVIRGRKDVATASGTVKVAKQVDNDHNGVLDLLTMSSSYGIQSNSTLSAWLGSLKNRQQSVSPPSPSSLNRLGQYWQLADLRIVLDWTSTSGPGGTHPIIVQDAAGNQDNTKTTLLNTFMNAKPGRIFYNDVPLSGKDNVTSCATSNSYCNRQSYTPNFATHPLVYACTLNDLNVNVAGCGSNTVAAADPRRGGFYSNREQKWVAMLNVNARDLLAWNRAQPSGSRLIENPDDGVNGGIVLYLAVWTGSNPAALPTPRLGVRVINSPNLDFPGPVIDPTGLTVISDQAIYIEGNYNVGDGATPDAGPHPKQPAAFMGDAINVLSTNWSGSHGTPSCSPACPANCYNDCQSRQALCCRKAENSTIYAALLGGVDVTTSGHYNGGLENYPRFHEDWGGKSLYYRGSFASLGASVHSNGEWLGTGNTYQMYNPPARLWDYDTDFQQVQKLPPATPLFVSVMQILFTENFR